MPVQNPVLVAVSAVLISAWLVGTAPAAEPGGQEKGKTIPAGSKVQKGPASKQAPADDKGLSVDPFATPERGPESPPQKPTITFEDLLKDAIPVTDLATLIEPLYARCEDKDDLPRRQCETVRGYLLDRLRSHTFVAMSDVVPDISPYDAAAKEIDMEVSGCLSCASPPVVAGEPRYLSTRPPQRVVGGKAVGAPLYSHQLTLDTKVRADRFLERIVPRLRVQQIFRVGQPFSEEGGKKYRGVLIQPVAHRVFDRCTGQITAAQPKASKPLKVVADATCPQKGAEELSEAEIVQAAQQASLPERLLPSQVEVALQPVQEKIHDCYVEFAELGGTVNVQLLLSGDGKLTQIALLPPYDKAAIGVCIRSQIKTAVFPRFRGDPMHIPYTFRVN